jgi:hypothetical protein
MTHACSRCEAWAKRDVREPEAIADHEISDHERYGTVLVTAR